MVIVDIPYVVEFWNETEKRQWKKSYGAVSPFEIKEISSQEAPVAVKWKHDIERQTVHSNETRWYDSAHWLPLEFHDRETGKHLHLTLKAYQLMVGRSYNTNGRLNGYVSATKRLENSALKQYFEKEIKELASRKPSEKYSWSTAEHVSNCIVDALSELIVIDGQIWTKSPEPLLTLSGTRDAPQIIPTAMRPTTDKGGTLFRIDRLDDFISQMQFENPHLPQISSPEISIIIPESIKYNDEEQSLRAVAGKLLKQSENLLHLVAWADSKCWYDMKNTLSQNFQRETDLEYLANLIEEVKTTFSRHFDDPNSIRLIVKNALNRWNLRPLDIMHISP